MSEQALLTAKEVSEKIGVHINTVRAMAEDGRLKGIKTKGEQGHWRFKSSVIEAFMNSLEEGSGSSILQDIILITDEIPEALLAGKSASNKKIWEFVNKYYGIRTVFGSYAIHADKYTYRNIIANKAFIWLGEGSANLMEFLNGNKNNRHAVNDKFNSFQTRYAFGVIKSPSIFEELTYSLIPLLIVKDEDANEWVVDGTLQQFYDLEKGIAVLPLNKAKELYSGLTVYEKREFAQLYSDPHITEKLTAKVKEMEK